MLDDSAPKTPMPSFFARVFHPEYNVDISEAEDTIDRFEKHVKASELGGGAKEVETSLSRVRESLRGAPTGLTSPPSLLKLIQDFSDSATHAGNLSHSLVRLVAGLALPPKSADALIEGEELAGAGESSADSERRRAMAWSMQTEDGALTWKEADDGASSAVTAAALVLTVVFHKQILSA